jgi:hypothetical protein
VPPALLRQPPALLLELAQLLRLVSTCKLAEHGINKCVCC